MHHFGRVKKIEGAQWIVHHVNYVIFFDNIAAIHWTHKFTQVCVDKVHDEEHFLEGVQIQMLQFIHLLLNYLRRFLSARFDIFVQWTEFLVGQLIAARSDDVVQFGCKHVVWHGRELAHDLYFSRDLSSSHRMVERLDHLFDGHHLFG